MQILDKNQKVLFEGDLPLKELLTKAVKMRADLAGAVLDGASLEGFDFTDCIFTDASFKGTSLKNAVFKNSHFYSCDFTGASFENVNLFRKAKFNECVFENVKLCNCIGEGVAFKNVNLGGFLVTFNETHLSVGCRQLSITEWQKLSENSEFFKDKDTDYFSAFMHYKKAVLELVELTQLEF